MTRDSADGSEALAVRILDEFARTGRIGEEEERLAEWRVWDFVTASVILIGTLKIVVQLRWLDGMDAREQVSALSVLKDCRLTEDDALLFIHAQTGEGGPMVGVTLVNARTGLLLQAFHADDAPAVGDGGA